jgi:hypothetical protein
VLTKSDQLKGNSAGIDNSKFDLFVSSVQTKGCTRRNPVEYVGDGSGRIDVLVLDSGSVVDRSVNGSVIVVHVWAGISTILVMTVRIGCEVG